jgi:hypothetical protein
MMKKFHFTSCASVFKLPYFAHLIAFSSIHPSTAAVANNHLFRDWFEFKSIQFSWRRRQLNEGDCFQIKFTSHLSPFRADIILAIMFLFALHLLFKLFRSLMRHSLTFYFILCLFIAKLSTRLIKSEYIKFFMCHNDE